MFDGVAETAKSGSHRVGGGLARNLSLASRLAMVVLTVMVISLLVVSMVSLSYGTRLADDLFEERMRALRSLKAHEIELYFNTTIAQTQALAASDMTIRAAQEFTQAYIELQGVDPGSGAREAVADYYRDVFGPELVAATGVSIPWQNLVPEGNAAVYLQNQYLVGDDVEADGEQLITDPGDGSTWTEVHRDVHPEFLDIAGRLSVGDLYIVEPSRGAIVYSVAKGPEFGTGLDQGPYSASALAKLVRAVRDSGSSQRVEVTDLAPYAPALGDPEGFVGAPIVAEGRLVGVLVVRIPVDQINTIMTSDGNWASEGLGDTGETYLVGSDGRMRSVSRFFLESPSEYFAAVEAAHSISSSDLESVNALETTVVFQKAADLDILEEVAAGMDEFFETKNYMGREAYSAYDPLDIEQLDWFATVEAEQSEVSAPLVDFRRRNLVVVSLTVLVISFVTVAWARQALAPVRAISERLRGRPGEQAEPRKERDARGLMEMEQLSEDIDRMMARAAQRQADVAAAAAERLDTLRGLLPSAIVERIEMGDRLVVEHVLQASIVVIALEGLGDLIRGSDPASGRPVIDEVVDLLDTLASDHGLERIRVIGDVYYAGCGLNYPYLDHAPRSVAFALEVREGIRDLGEARGLEATAGIHSGPVSVGLAGSSRLVYDAWGESLTTAYVLAHTAQPGEIRISPETKDMLPPDLAVRPSSDGVTWVVTAEQPATEDPVT